MDETVNREDLFLLLGIDRRIPNLAEVGAYRIHHAYCMLSPHVHDPERLEICLVTGGTQMHVIDGRRFHVDAGQGIVIRPGETHGDGNTVQERSTAKFIILRVDRRPRVFLGMHGPDADALRHAILHDLPRVFPVSPSADRVFDLLTESLRRWQTSEAEDSLDAAAAGLLTASLLIEILHTPPEMVRKAPSTWLNQIERLIAIHARDPLPPRRLAALVNMSVSHFKARFKKETGVSPSDYVWRRKVDMAKTLLKRPDVTVTRIAFDLGFSSSQNFATLFKKYTGFTPLKYRQFRWTYMGPDFRKER